MSVEENGEWVGSIFEPEEEPLVLWLTYEKAGEKQLRHQVSPLYARTMCRCARYKGTLLARFLHFETRCQGGGEDILGWALGVNMIYVIRLIKRLSELRKTFERGERWFQTWYYRARSVWRWVYTGSMSGEKYLLVAESSVLTFDSRFDFV